MDIDTELDAHEKLTNWNEHNNAILALKKELSTLEPALQRADKSVEKAQKDIADLEDATCYACGQALHDDKKEELETRKAKELEDAQHIPPEIKDKMLEVEQGLQDIGEINGKLPTTFTKLLKKHTNIGKMLTV